MVKIIQTTTDLEKERQLDTTAPGFVPTMGNLHAGHISLLREALSFHNKVYFSIFVNPKQFGPKEDFARYPRTLEKDINLIQELLNDFPTKEVVVYAPLDPKEVFPEGKTLTITVPDLSNVLEGKIRPGHFDGVTTVVYRLFELVKPLNAFFGLKDYQQFLVIKKMVKDLNLPVKVLGLPIIREVSGLAMSSRNQYLSNEEKEEALILSRSMQNIAKKLNGKKSQIPEAESLIASILQDKRWNYLEMRDAETLSVDLTHSNFVSILGVFQLGSTRLLDNMQVELK